MTVARGREDDEDDDEDYETRHCGGEGLGWAGWQVRPRWVSLMD